MGKPNLNILRTVRLQLKSGYLKHEPASYTFMKRYPPLSRDTAPPVRKIENINIPYLKHYENVVAKNPIYADERVYPAYWQQEPQALTLAKKQYELMQEGMDEEGAYDEAMKYIETLESKSYAELKSLLEKGGVKDARKPFTADATVADAITSLRAKLKETPYNQMELAEQGEIDYIVQSKVLKWNEVERERRMKDPLFVVQFEKLREVLFPEIAESTSERLKGREEFKDKLLGLFQVNKSRLCTAVPFYYEEYTGLFAKLKAEPMLGRWNEREREVLSRWIIDTLALREIIEKSPTVKVQRYLDDLRAQFFPMVRYPDRSSSFEVPSVENFKAILFNNGVGYKRDGNKGLYVRRYYRIPMLLFPKETFTTSLLMDKERAKAVAQDEKSLLQEVMSAGLDEASLPELQQQLRDLLAGDASVGSISSDYGVRGGEGGGVDMSQLDALLREADDDDTDDFAEVDGEEEEIEVEEEEEEEEVDEALMAEGEWDLLVKKYVREPTTDLERERDEFLGNMEHSSWKDATSEIELYAFHRDRTENQLIIRARLSVEYEKKEAARRFREWRRRGVWIEKLPPPALELIDNRNS